MKINSTFLKKIVALICVIIPVSLFAQDTPAEETPMEKEYVRATFENGVLINNNTVEVPGHKSLDFNIQHRFGLIKDEKDLFGIYAPANIRMGLTYGITSNLAIGVGASKNKMIYDLNAKYVILKQTKEKGTPVTLAYFGDVGKSALGRDNFVNAEGDYKMAYKVSYFHQLMVARKFNSHLSLQLGATYSHYNIVDSAYGQHDFYGASFVGRYKFSAQSSIAIDFDYLLNVSDIEEDARPKPNLGIGYEVSTGSHQFQIFICTSSSIINQELRVFNTNDFADGDVLLGFNITRSWGFK
jgi:hypothetical protein